MTVLQASAALTLWRSGKFDTLDISRVLGGALPKRTFVGCLMPFAGESEVLTSSLCWR